MARITDHPNMSSPVYRRRKAKVKQTNKESVALQREKSIFPGPVVPIVTNDWHIISIHFAPTTVAILHQPLQRVRIFTNFSNLSIYIYRKNLLKVKFLGLVHRNTNWLISFSPSKE